MARTPPPAWRLLCRSTNGWKPWPFDYRQRHSVELEARLNVLAQIKLQFPHWTHKLGEDHLLDLAVLGQVVKPR